MFIKVYILTKVNENIKIVDSTPYIRTQSCHLHLCLAHILCDSVSSCSVLSMAMAINIVYCIRSDTHNKLLCEKRKQCYDQPGSTVLLMPVICGAAKSFYIFCFQCVHRRSYKIRMQNSLFEKNKRRLHRANGSQAKECHFNISQLYDFSSFLENIHLDQFEMIKSLHQSTWKF